MSDACGAVALILGIEFVCDQTSRPTHIIHQHTDSVGVMRWRDGVDGPVVVSAKARCDGWPVSSVDHPCGHPDGAGHEGDCR